MPPVRSPIRNDCAERVRIRERAWSSSLSGAGWVIRSGDPGAELGAWSQQLRLMLRAVQGVRIGWGVGRVQY